MSTITFTPGRAGGGGGGAGGGDLIRETNGGWTGTGGGGTGGSPGFFQHIIRGDLNTTQPHPGDNSQGDWGGGILRFAFKIHRGNPANTPRTFGYICGPHAVLVGGITKQHAWGGRGEWVSPVANGWGGSVVRGRGRVR